jgi:hypothetical protein
MRHLHHEQSESELGTEQVGRASLAAFCSTRQSSTASSTVASSPPVWTILNPAPSTQLIPAVLFIGWGMRLGRLRSFVPRLLAFIYLVTGNAAMPLERLSPS